MPYLQGFTAIVKTSAIAMLAVFSMLFCAALLSFTATPAQARAAVNATIGEINLSALPKEAQTTLKQIKSNGPYDYPKDGVVFSNRERILPKQKRGYYREFTVKTPGARNRAARRIVAGEVGEYYYTDDHYASFKRIKQ